MTTISHLAISGTGMLKSALLTAIMLLSACETTGESFPDKAKHYSEAASLRPIRFSRKNELRLWRLSWWPSGRVVTEQSLSFYGKYDDKTEQFLSFEKKRVSAPEEFVSDLQKLSALDGRHITCDSDVLDWPVYVVEGNWEGKYFTFFADIEMCTSDELKILQKYSGYAEMIEVLEKK